jgi:hypothetical protein
LSCSHRSNSGHDSGSRSEIWKSASTASDATNSIVEGITIDRSDEDENADDSIRVNPELDSNEIDESDLQFKNILNKEFQHLMES